MPDFEIRWIDAGVEPSCAPDPEYPQGRDVDVSKGAALTCRVTLPYPARRIGHYLVVCKSCGLRVAETTAGRPDDPRSLTLACKTGPRQ